MQDAYLLFATLLVTIIFFVWGIWRYDVVAVLALMTLVVLGIVPIGNAFSGFSNPAVITVACVMIITQVIIQSGVIDYILKKLAFIANKPTLNIAVLCFMAAFLSAFMNNVGALALMMPIAIHSSLRANRSPSLILMPLAFSSVLGGMTTVIGTPPNLLISNYRQQIIGQPFAMFDFSPVGLVVALITIVFIVFLGWKLLSTERKTPKPIDELFQIQDYITEVRISESSPVIDSTIRELEKLTEGDFTVLGIIRKKKKRIAIAGDEKLQAKDILIIEASHNELEKLIHKAKLEILGEEKFTTEKLRTDNISLIEAVVPQGSRLEGRTAQMMRLRSRYHVNLIAIARQGKPFKNRLNHVKLRAGDIVLLQGEAEDLQENILSLGFLPLVERGVQVGSRRKVFFPILIFLGVILLAAFQIFPIQIAFTIGILIFILFNFLPTRRLYDNINWSVIILLGAMIPLGNALQTTGANNLIANALTPLTQTTHPIVIMGLLMIITMSLSDVMNNAATAVVMAPIAVSIANTMNANIDPFLMTVAIGASCSFLTPISHQNNTLILGPGGYKFTDYIRLGLPVELIVLITALPMILWIWPL